MESTWTDTSEKQITLTHAAHALRMVKMMPGFANNPAFPDDVRNACLESYFVNARLLIEFLQAGGTSRDFRRADFLPGAPDIENIESLDRLWEISTKQVVHLRWRKADEKELSEPVDTSSEGLRILAERLVGLMDQFFELLQKNSPHEAVCP